MKTLKAPFYGVHEFLPEKERWCLCILSNGKIRSGFYDPIPGTDKCCAFWDTEYEDARIIGRNGIIVEYWTYEEDVKIQ